MTNKKTLTILGLCLSLTFFNSCEKKNDNPVTTVEEDKENVEELFDDVVKKAEDFKNGCGLTSIESFLSLDNGEIRNNTWVSNITRELEKVLDYNYIDQSKKVDFNRHTGTYSWNPSATTFTRTSAPNDKIIVMSPSEMGVSSNNITTTFSSYTQQRTVFDGKQYWLPNSMKVDVDVDNSPCIGIELKEAAYDQGTFMMPNKMDMVITLAPFDFKFESSKNSDNNSYDMKMTAISNGKEEFSFEGDISFADNDFHDFVSEDIDHAVGKFTFGHFTIPFDVNVKALQDLLNPNQTQINEMIKVSVEYKGRKIADLEFEQGNTNTISIIYKDDTREDLYNNYKDLVDRLEVVFSNFLYYQ